MQTVRMAFILSVLIGMDACTKQEEQPNVQGTSTDYMQLHTGNYWIYQEYRVTDTGVFDEHVTDSVYVEKDTTIGNRLFHKLVSRSHWTSASQGKLLRDSLGYIVDPNGTVHFASHDFTTVFRKGILLGGGDTMAEFTAKMIDRDFAVSTPAGVFIISAFTTQYDIFPKFQVPGNEVLHYRTRYANGVGMVTQVLAVYMQTTDIWERRLVRYHVQ